MAGSMAGFFKQNAVRTDTGKVVASKAFLDEKGKPIEWEICCVTARENSDIQKACMKRVPVPGKRNQFTHETDYGMYTARLAARCTL